MGPASLTDVSTDVLVEGIDDMSEGPESDTRMGASNVVTEGGDAGGDGLAERE